MIALRWRETIRSSCLKKFSYYSFNCLSEKNLHDEPDEYDSLKHIWFIAKRSQTKIIHNVEIWSTGREINSAIQTLQMRPNDQY